MNQRALKKPRDQMNSGYIAALAPPINNVEGLGYTLLTTAGPMIVTFDHGMPNYEPAIDVKSESGKRYMKRFGEEAA